MVPTTRLGKTLAGAASSEDTPALSVRRTRLRQAINGRRGEEVTLPVIGRVFLELPGALRWQEIEAATARRLRELEAPIGIEGVAMREAELAMRVIAESARDPDDRAVAFGTFEEWGELDNDLIALTWHAFGDVRERLDPVASNPTDDELLAISHAVKKKDPALLRSYGVVKLSAWLATTVDPPSISPTPSLQSSDSSSDLPTASE